MKKLNQKGITILEVIIAIAIFTTIIFVGYGVLDKYHVSVENQSITNKRHLAINNMNKYITKDLEKSTNIKLLLDGEEIASTNNLDNSESVLNEKIKDIKNKILINDNVYYEYEISSNKSNEQSDIVARYIIEISKKNNNMKYTISREDNNKVKIEFTDNEELNKDELPLVIKGNNPYTVILGYSEKDTKFNEYEFTVTSRINYLTLENVEQNPSEEVKPEEKPENSPEDIPEDIPVYPTVPDDMDKLTTKHIGFWISDKSQHELKNGVYEKSIYTWVGNKGEFGSQSKTSKEVFDITANNNKSGNSGKTESSISDSISNIKVYNTITKANGINAIKIFVSPYTSISNLNLKFDKGTYSGIKDVETGATINSSNYILNSGENGKWYEIIYKPSANDQFSFEMSAKLNIDKSKVSSGYAMLIYGTKINTYNSGDIVYEWQTKKENNQIKYGVQAYATVGNDQNIRIEEQANLERNMSIQIDKGSTPPIIRARGLNNEIATSEPIFKDIKSIQLKVEGQLKLTNVKFNNTTISDLNYLNNSVVIDLNQSNMSNSLEANFNFSNMQEDKSYGKLIINFIYNN